MNLDYIANRAETERTPFVISVTAVFLRNIAKHLSSAELELSVLKQRSAPPGINRLHDYTDANQHLLDAMEEVLGDGLDDEGVDVTNEFVGGVFSDVWKLSKGLLEAAFRDGWRAQILGNSSV